MALRTRGQGGQLLTAQHKSQVENGLLVFWWAVDLLPHSRGFNWTLRWGPPRNSGVDTNSLNVSPVVSYLCYLVKCWACTANRNPVPCEPIPTRKNLFSLQGTHALIAGSLFSLQGFPCKPLYFRVRDCSATSVFSKLSQFIESMSFF